MTMSSMYRVVVLQEGYSEILPDGNMRANGTSTLVIGPKHKVVVDTLSPWDKEALVVALSREGLTPGDVTELVCTHGHPDHVGNNNLFVQAKVNLEFFALNIYLWKMNHRIIVD